MVLATTITTVAFAAATVVYVAVPSADLLRLRNPLFWLLAVTASGASRPVTAAETLSHGRFKSVQVYRPSGPVKHVGEPPESARLDHRHDRGRA